MKEGEHGSDDSRLHLQRQEFDIKAVSRKKIVGQGTQEGGLALGSVGAHEDEITRLDAHLLEGPEGQRVADHLVP